MFSDMRGVLHILKQLPFFPKEILVSENYKNVFRGMHKSPYAKYIYVIKGSIKDFFWNGQLTQKVLNKGDGLYIPENASHGFMALEDSVVLYLLEECFDEKKDQNIHWSTPEYGLPNITGIISDKDRDSKYATQSDYLVLGSSGYLGQNCVKYLKEAGRKVFESNTRLENHSKIAEEIQKSGAKYVICAAGISGRPTIDWCDTHEHETYVTNYLSILNLIEVCKNVHLTIFGSGAVYSGNKKVYTENDPVDFTSKVYSKWRCKLEEHVSTGILYLRIMYPCSFDGHPKCFRSKMITRRGNIHDGCVSITSIPDLFPYISSLVERKIDGIFNFVTDGSVSLGEIAGDSNTVQSCDSRGNYELSAKKLFAYIPLIKTIDVIQKRCES